MSPAEVEGLLVDLRQGDPWKRCRAADLLGDAPATPEVLGALVEALTDPTDYETPGDYDAPPFYHDVASKAAQSLRQGAIQVVPQLVRTMRASDAAARHVALLLAYCQEAGVEPLLELSRHPSESVRAESVVALVRLRQNLPPQRGEELLSRLLAMLVDPSSEVTYASVNQLTYLAKEGLDLGAYASQGLVAALVERMRKNPLAETFFRAASFLASREEIWRGWVDLAVSGNELATRFILDDLPRLDDEEVERLIQSPHKTVGLIVLMGGLGARAVAAIEWLTALLSDPQKGAAAALALVRIPAGAEAALPYLAPLFVESTRVRQSIYDWHPRPELLAGQVLPGLVANLSLEPQLQMDALDGLAILGPLAADALPAALPLLQPYTIDYVRLSALKMVARLGPAAEPAFTALVRLLDLPWRREEALQTIIALGQAARGLEPILQVLALESPPQPESALALALAALA